MRSNQTPYVQQPISILLYEKSTDTIKKIDFFCSFSFILSSPLFLQKEKEKNHPPPILALLGNPSYGIRSWGPLFSLVCFSFSNKHLPFLKPNKGRKKKRKEMQKNPSNPINQAFQLSFPFK